MAHASEEIDLYGETISLETVAIQPGGIDLVIAESGQGEDAIPDFVFHFMRPEDFEQFADMVAAFRAQVKTMQEVRKA